MLLLLRREWLLALRQRRELLNPILFFIMVAVLFPFGVSPDPERLQFLAPGIVWVAALLATLLGLEALWRSDYEDGALEQMVLSNQPLPLYALAKITVHWLLTGLPLALIAPLLAGMLNLPVSAWGTLTLTLLLGTPTLSLIGGIGAALTVGLRRGGVLLSLLVLPLYIPVLIFAARAVELAASGLAIRGPLYLLTALLLLALTLAPLAAAAALRVSMSER